MGQACEGCGATRREVNWSVRLGRHVCRECYLPGAPTAPDHKPYRRPKPPPPSPRERASAYVRRQMEAVAPVALSGYDVIGTCPLCLHSLFARVGRHATVLECDGGCPEDLVWREFE